MATANKTKPTQTELKVSYSVGVKAQIVKYELTADAHISRGESWNVEGLSQEEIDAFYEDRYAILQEELGIKIAAEHEEMMSSS